MLEFAGIEVERFQTRWVSSSEGEKFASIITKLTEEITALGPNRKYRDSL